jgi:cell division protein ZapE
MTPLELYNQYLATQQYKPDGQQKQAILLLQRVYDELSNSAKPLTWQQRIVNKIKKMPATPIKGVYLWGGVGIGKTWLMDMFYQSLTIPNKMRMHFHRFMQQVHLALKELQGHADPLTLVAQRFAKQAKVICFDEFLVNDIVDAMILANLLKALFAEGITLVTTANTPPDDLYRNGIQREYFMPAIHLLKQNLEIIHLTTEYDYRLRALEQAGTYYYPLGAEADVFMRNSFKQLTRLEHTDAVSTPLMIEEREIPVIAHSNQVAWFDFNVLCNVPRSQLDYLEIGRCFATVLLSNVPKIQSHQDNLIRYLINLVDVFYDARVKLIISAAVPVPELYESGRLAFEFKRTQSRLLEMQSKEYLSLPHLSN